MKLLILTVVAVAFNLARDSHGMRTGENLFVDLRIRKAAEVAPIGVAPFI